jgi:hypothetical protein
LATTSVILDGIRNESNSTRRFCSQVAEPISIETRKEFANIKFISTQQPRNHFSLSWTTIGRLNTFLIYSIYILGCGGRITTSGDMIEVDEHLDTTGDNYLLCEWSIIAPIGYRVLFRLKQLLLTRFGTTGSCSYDFSYPMGFVGLAVRIIFEYN